MTLRFTYVRMDDWPALSWLARCVPETPAVEVYHGRGVETRDHWFCEAVWDGDFAAGDFDRTDVVFGSGGRLRDGRITFVSHASTIDRLQHVSCDGAVWISNSLACLLAAVGADPDPLYPHYERDLSSITRGIDGYERTLATSRGDVHLAYFRNLVWNGRWLTEADKPEPARELRDFESYTGALRSSLVELARNMSSPVRARSLSWLTTLSSGYDSPAVAALARAAGLERAVSFDRSQTGDRDDGAEVAKHLGLDLTTVSRDAWRERASAEIPFIAADGLGRDVNFAGFEPLLPGRVLLTGTAGGWLWSMKDTGRNGDLSRGDASQLSLSEYRLSVGFIVCPLPFLGLRRIEQIKALSRSPEMRPWDVGGSYSRPIPRRILEEAGVPRAAFGLRKRAATVRVRSRQEFADLTDLDDYLGWLRARAGEWLVRGRIPPHALASVLEPIQSILIDITRPRRPITRETATGLVWRLHTVVRREYLHKFLFAWAIDRAKAAYARGLCSDQADVRARSAAAGVQER